MEWARIVPLLCALFFVALTGCKEDIEESPLAVPFPNVTSLEIESNSSILVRGTSLQYFSSGYLENQFGDRANTQMRILSSTEISLTPIGAFDYDLQWRVVLDANSTQAYISNFFSIESPYRVSFLVNNNDTYSQSLTVSITATLTGSIGDLHEIFVSESQSACEAASSFASYAPAMNYTLAAGEGMHTVWARFKSSDGTLSPCVSESIIVDSTLPVLTVTNADPLYLNSSNTMSFSISGTCESGTNVRYRLVKVSDSSVVFDNSTLCSSSTFAVASLSNVGSEGDYDLLIDQTDAAGNVAAQVSHNVTKDTISPSVGFSGLPSDPNNLTSVGPIDLSAGESFSYSFAIISGASTGCGSATYSSTLADTVDITGAAVPTADGDKTLCVRATDLAGNSSTANTTWEFDGTAPALSVTGLTPGSLQSAVYYTSSTTPTFSFSVSDNNEPVNMRLGTSCGAGATGNFSSSAVSIALGSALSVGANSLCARTTDLAGNTSDLSLSVTYDNTAPTATISSPSVAAVNASGSIYYDIVFAGEDSISLVAGDVSLTGTTTGCGVSFSTVDAHTRRVTITGCSGNGSLGISIPANKSSDYAGNGNLAASSSTSVTIDNAGPGGTGLSIDGGVSSTLKKTVTLNFSYDGTASEMKYSYTADCSTGSWVAVSASAAGIAHTASVNQTVTMSVVYRDSLGNESSCVTDTILFDYLTVVSKYSGYGSYLGYVTNASTEVSPVECSTGNNDTCTWTGELRKVVTGESSCSGLAMTDALAAFDWSCSASSGTATFYSRLKTGKSLRDLVQASPYQFIANSVTLTGSSNSSTVSQSLSDWWTDSVSALSDSSSAAVTLPATVGSIYVYNSDITSRGYKFSADKQAIVGLGTSKITGAASGNQNCGGLTCLIWNTTFSFTSFVGVISSGTSASNVFRTTSSSAAFQRIVETDIIDGTTSPALYFTGGRGYYLKNVDVLMDLGVSADAIRFDNTAVADGVLFDGVTVSNGAYGIRFDGGTQNSKFWNVNLANQATAGFYLYSASVITGGNTIEGLRVFNCLNNPVYIENHTNNYLSNVLVASSTNGISFIQSSRNYLTNFSSYGVYNTHLKISNSHDGNFQNILAYRSDGSVGIGLGSVSNSIDNSISQLALGDHFRPATAQAGYSNSYSGVIMTPSAAVCGGGGNLAVNCDFTGATNVNLSAIPSYVGALADIFTYNSSRNWLNFTNAFQFSGFEGSTAGLMSSITANACNSGTCRSWELSLLNTDTNVLARSFDGSSAQTAPVAAALCPSSIDGNVETIDAAGTTTQRYLRLATEIINSSHANYSSTGDHDGLCESNESCIYTPNFGLYQGHGTLESCVFQNGANVTGVQMYFYSTNGY